AAGLVMAILGGAILPLFQAAIIDSWSVIVSYVVPALCFLLVAGYGLFDIKNKATRTTTANSANSAPVTMK
ncbi:MAG TPA: hypothetical protein DHW66_05210, partial [Alteromonas sp.]|nr:hypothetical protein [Alteromonas sp.]